MLLTREEMRSIYAEECGLSLTQKLAQLLTLALTERTLYQYYFVLHVDK